MAGNVWEWCADWYDENYYTNSPVNNPQGPDAGNYRVLRGGLGVTILATCVLLTATATSFRIIGLTTTDFVVCQDSLLHRGRLTLCSFTTGLLY